MGYYEKEFIQKRLSKRGPKLHYGQRQKAKLGLEALRFKNRKRQRAAHMVASVRLVVNSMVSRRLFERYVAPQATDPKTRFPRRQFVFVTRYSAACFAGWLGRELDILNC